MNNQLIDDNEDFQDIDAKGYEGDDTMPDNPDETEQPSVVNEQDNDVVNDEGYNQPALSTENEDDLEISKDPGGDSQPPEIDIDPETPAVERPTMSY